MRKNGGGNSQWGVDFLDGLTVIWIMEQKTFGPEIKIRSQDTCQKNTF